MPTVTVKSDAVLAVTGEWDGDDPTLWQSINEDSVTASVADAESAALPLSFGVTGIPDGATVTNITLYCGGTITDLNGPSGSTTSLLWEIYDQFDAIIASAGE